jgi:hypothetical protein
MKRRPPPITGVFYFMEIWKSIQNYEGLYEVSNLGRVKSLKFNKEKILSQGMLRYCNVVLWKNSIGITRTVHQLVAESFLNHTPNGMKLVVDHINDDKLDNRVENLQIVTTRFNAYKTQGKYSSKYKGVSWDKKLNKWRAMISINGKLKHLGYFNCELLAYHEYEKYKSK